MPSLVEISLVFLEKKIFNVCQSILAMYLPFEKGGALHLNKFEPSSPKTALCYVWLKFAQWFWRIFVNFINVFSLFRNYLPLEKGRTLKETWILSLKDALCQVCLKLAKWLSRKRFFKFNQYIFTIS